MAAYSEKVPLTEEDYEEETAAAGGCFSAFFCCARSHYLRANERLSLLQEQLKETRWKDSLQRLKESSELIAGPKWKTFIRRFNCHSCAGAGANHRNRKPNFQYDPQSYALNFDGGADPDDEEDDRNGFSSQFGSLSAKNTAEFGRGSRAGHPLNR
ncbi:hypothetical protein ACLOJK_027502 [Asimina triloba]